MEYRTHPLSPIPPFPREYRAFGILLPVLSLPSHYGSGDLGPTAHAWVSRPNEAGQAWWQALPLGSTGYGNSPYQSLSSFAGNELLLSPDFLVEEDLLRQRDCEGCTFPPGAIDYDAVVLFKGRLIEKAWKNFSDGARADLWDQFDESCNAQAHWLQDYALFRALKIKYRGTSYFDWPLELVQRQPAKLFRAGEEAREVIQQVCTD